MMFIPLKINQKEFGLGRVGVLDKPVRFSDFCTASQGSFSNWTACGSLQKDDTKMIQRVAICGGSGEKNSIMMHYVNKPMSILLVMCIIIRHMT